MDTDKYANGAIDSADRIANKLHNGIRDTYQGARAAESRLADRAEDLAGALAGKADDAVAEASGRIKEGIRGARNAVQSGGETIRQSSEAILTFTREKPVQALLIAAVSGAFLWALARGVSARD